MHAVNERRNIVSGLLWCMLKRVQGRGIVRRVVLLPWEQAREDQARLLDSFQDQDPVQEAG